MDRNSIIGILLIVAIFFGYQYIMMPSAEERAALQHQQDSIANAAIEEQARHAEAALAQQRQQELDSAHRTLPEDSLLSQTAKDSLVAAKLAERYGLFSPAAKGRNQVVTIANRNLQVAINTFGARPNVIRLKDYKTYHGKPLCSPVPDSGNYEFNFFLGNLKLSTKDLNFTATPLDSTGVRAGGPHHRPRQVPRHHLPAGQRLLVHGRHRRAGGPGERGGPAQRDVPLEPDRLPQRKAPAHGGTAKCTVYYKYFSDDRNYLSETKRRQQEA
jgi:hypothetical protein